jgi:hypothetical protein
MALYFFCLEVMKGRCIIHNVIKNTPKDKVITHILLEYAYDRRSERDYLTFPNRTVDRQENWANVFEWIHLAPSSSSFPLASYAVLMIYEGTYVTEAVQKTSYPQAVWWNITTFLMVQE